MVRNDELIHIADLKRTLDTTLLSSEKGSRFATCKPFGENRTGEQGPIPRFQIIRRADYIHYWAGNGPSLECPRPRPSSKDGRGETGVGRSICFEFSESLQAGAHQSESRAPIKQSSMRVRRRQTGNLRTYRRVPSRLTKLEEISRRLHLAICIQLLKFAMP